MKIFHSLWKYASSQAIKINSEMKKCRPFGRTGGIGFQTVVVRTDSFS
jgi:hypothetical protein